MEGKLYLIDKHATHERMIFEELKSDDPEPVQWLVAPLLVKVSKTEAAVLAEHLDELSRIGFEAEDFGDGSLIIRTIPSRLGGMDYSSLLSEIAESLATVGTTEIERLEKIYHQVACKAACKAGSFSSTPELLTLARRAVFDPKIRYCPHGRPVAIELTQTELEKMFGRIQ